MSITQITFLERGDLFDAAIYHRIYIRKHNSDHMSSSSHMSTLRSRLPDRNYQQRILVSQILKRYLFDHTFIDSNCYETYDTSPFTRECVYFLVDCAQYG